MGEGCRIFPNQEFETELDRRDQVNLVTNMLVEFFDRLAPGFGRVQVAVVGGNHGENRVDGKRTTRSDNDDLLVFENAARVAGRVPQLQHVEWAIAGDGAPGIAVDAGGWRVGTTHGHVFKKGQGVEGKVWTWFSSMAAAREPVGQADLLVTHHHHHHAVKDFGPVVWVQTPALDGGSPWYTDWTGQSSQPAMLSWVMTPEQRYVLGELR